MTSAQHEVAIVIGPNGSGKTALTRRLIYDFDRTRQPWQSIIILDENEQYENSIEPDSDAVGFENQLREIADTEEGLLVIDDADVFLPKVLSRWMFRFIRKQRHFGFAMILQTSAPQDLPPRLNNLAKYIYFYRSLDPNVTKRIGELTGRSAEQIEKLYPQHKYQYCLIMPHENQGAGAVFYGFTPKRFAVKGSEVYPRQQTLWQKIKLFFEDIL